MESSVKEEVGVGDDAAKEVKKEEADSPINDEAETKKEVEEDEAEDGELEVKGEKEEEEDIESEVEKDEDEEEEEESASKKSSGQEAVTPANRPTRERKKVERFTITAPSRSPQKKSV